MRRLARGLVGDVHRAGDVDQEAYLAALQARVTKTRRFDRTVKFTRADAVPGAKPVGIKPGDVVVRYDAVRIRKSDRSRRSDEKGRAPWRFELRRGTGTFHATVQGGRLGVTAENHLADSRPAART